MASVVDICNRVSSKLGAARITSLQEDTPVARAYSAAFGLVRDAELRRHTWNFALKRVVLAPDATAPLFGFEYRFELPVDFLRLHPDHDYQVETDWQIEGRQIHTNDGPALYLRYVARISDTSLWDALFIDAFACRLALELCEELTQSNTKKESIREDYRVAIREAKAVNAIEKVSDNPPEDEWVGARL